ncbi:SMP-30/gluconolactonase/LRE family protein [Alteromonas sediminis]|uniref:SMP-30/gluconolactonase/LRE family protein n=1 Tax=Alteromonas sediminis TaxID=2259342 RepID=A0A3N5Y6F2_9ALTE|nr:SMP-30/gluconolactonase/LRE family protein [Alteromonas sediminis]RPJ66039.1 SMP-30/gluconolactonase/LRE family protein [Alteromonas sediminis]
MRITGKRALLFILFLSVLYLLLWPVSIQPVAWEAPVDNGLTGDFAQNQGLSDATFYATKDDHGPEDFALHPDGRIFMSLHSGFIGIFNPTTKSFSRWVNTKGRPLGIEFDAKGNLLVADAYQGLLSISPEGRIQALATDMAGTPILYADDVDIAANGKVYFSDASTRFSPAEHGGTLAASVLDIMEHSGNGRLLEYDPAQGTTRLVATGLNFANGVAVSHEQTSVLVIETGSYRVTRVAIDDNNFGQKSILIDNLPGFPDNLSRGSDNTYWLGLASPRNTLLDGLSSWPELRKIIQRLPATLRPKPVRYGHVVNFDDAGTVKLSLQDPSGKYGMTTGVIEVGEQLYISSLTEPKFAVLTSH